MAHTTYLIIGGGMTGAAAAKGIRELDSTGAITLVSAMPEPPYERPPLSKKLWDGKRTIDQIYVELPDNVKTILDRRIDNLDVENRRPQCLIQKRQPLAAQFLVVRG